MAAEQGVGSCWCQIHLRSSLLGDDAEENVRKILSVPEEYRVVGILALGTPEKDIQPHSRLDADPSKIHNIILQEILGSKQSAPAGWLLPFAPSYRSCISK